MDFTGFAEAGSSKEAKVRLERRILSMAGMAGRHEVASAGTHLIVHGDHHHGCSTSERERRAVLGSWTFIPEIERVIFNDPATIVIFKNGEKIVVKRTEDDEFNPEAGLAMAIARKYMGSRTAFKKLVKENGGYDSGE